MNETPEDQKNLDDYLLEITGEIRRLKEILKNSSTKNLDPTLTRNDLLIIHNFLEKNLEKIKEVQKEVPQSQEIPHFFFEEIKEDRSKAHEKLLKSLKEAKEEIEIIENRYKQILKEAQTKKEAPKVVESQQKPPEPKMKKRRIRGVGGSGGIKA